MRVGIVGAGSVGRALGAGLVELDDVEVVYGVRNPSDTAHQTLGTVATAAEAAAGSDVVVLAVPATAVADLVPALELRDPQIIVDATNAVRTPVPDGYDTMGAFVGSLLPARVLLVKAFNTIGAEHLGDGRFGSDRAFLPIAGDEQGLDVVEPLAESLGFAPVVLGGRETFGLVEAHAALWIHLAFNCGWGRSFGFVTRDR